MNTPQAKTGVEVERLPEPAAYRCWIDRSHDRGFYDYGEDVADMEGYDSFERLFSESQLLAALAAERAEAVRMREENEKLRADAERYRFLQQATESQVWQFFDRAETDEHLNTLIDAARAALSPSQQGEPR